MLSPLKKSQNNTGDINQQLHNTIYKKVTKKTHNHESPKKNGDGTIKKCIELFKKEANPNVLIKLEKSLKEQEESYNYYTKKFLPVLETEVMKLEVELSVSNNEREQLQRSPTRRGKILEIISGITKRSSSVSSIPNAVEENIEDQMQLGHIEEQNNTQETPLNVAEKKSGDTKILGQLDIPKEVSRKYSKVMEQLKKNIKTPKLGNGSGSDSGINSPGLSEKNSISPINSRKNSLTSIASTSSEESLNSTLSSVEEDNGLQPEGGEKTELLESNLESPKENETQVQPEQTVKKEPKMQENENSDGQANPDQVKKDILLKNQPNNRNLHVALVAGCALSTIGCIVAGAMTSGLIGAGLLAMAAVFAIAAVAELHSNFLSSKLTSINVSPLVDDKELTACSRL
ncbi:hypothetical protein HUB92_03575 [Wolbachia endosymbiont of Wiebesia pumilae]|uniref:hypothetical protein n=1 Tax=Wolbachia endosymbiont of Wiebesia pumilae TaxID=2742717 RepID=UPI001AE42F5B|nr:hypothetical protein [Wolbachia endosymbiont of Wiebesia pumilae]QTP61976.1 hypothetical protein HUB92_03575 [Wolbachia endosymbiont of Wiebesia pumilae]